MDRVRVGGRECELESYWGRGAVMERQRYREVERIKTQGQLKRPEQGYTVVNALRERERERERESMGEQLRRVKRVRNMQETEGV